MISSLALLLVFFRVMVWHGSERVNGDQVRSPHREVTITATVLCTARLHTCLKISTESEYSVQKQVPHTVTDHQCALKILESMSEFNGLWKHSNNPACSKRPGETLQTGRERVKVCMSL